MKNITLLELLGIRISQRNNTRRNRRRAIARWMAREDARMYAEPCHWSANENRIRCIAHLADCLDQGITLKAYSAWSGCKVRELSKRLHDYYHRRLPGQNQLGTLAA